jgi:hypothetical protein
MEQNLFIGNHSTGGGVRAFLDRIDVLSTYLPLFPPILNVTYQDLTNQEKQLMLFDALPKDNIEQIKKANQVPLEMPLEDETKFNEVKNSNSTETKDSSNNNNHTLSQKNGNRNGKGKFKKGKKNGQGNHTSSILDGQAKTICSFGGNIGHVENTCRAK